MKRIVVLEPICDNVFHSKFNSAFINEHYKGDNVTVCCSARHWECLKNKIKPQIKYKNISLLPKKIIRLISWLRKNKEVFNEIDEVVFLSSNIFVMYLIVILRLGGVKKVKYIIHADLENIKNLDRVRDKFLFFRRHKFLIKLLDIMKVELIVLGDCIKVNLESIVRINRCKAIEHSYDYNNKVVASLTKKKNKNLVIGFLGVGSKEKGFDWLHNEILSLQSESIGVQFKLIGSSNLISDYNLNHISFPFKDRAYISDEEIIEEAQKLDFVIFPFERDSYKLRASGTFFDAMEARVPILTTENDYLTEMLSKEGIKGIFFEREKGLIKLINKVTSLSDENYIELIRNIDFFVKKRE